MSKHVLPATDKDEERIVWLRPDPDPKQDPGWRLRLEKQKGDVAFFFEEQVLPERVDNPEANRIIDQHSHMMLTRPEAEWLRDALTEMLAMGDEW